MKADWTRIGLFAASAASGVLLLGAWFQWPYIKEVGGFTEAIAFVTGWICVYLTVKENIWNWSIGIANCAFYVIVYGEKRLWGDATLQVIYIVLSVIGWYMWLFGGEQKTMLKVSRTPLFEWPILVLVAAAAIWWYTGFLASRQDSAPFLDALTTVVSLVAQYLLTRKYIENWIIWISVDVIYVYLYIIRSLNLTAFLYVLYLGLAVTGFLQWRKSMTVDSQTAHEETYSPTHG